MALVPFPSHGGTYKHILLQYTSLLKITEFTIFYARMTRYWCIVAKHFEFETESEIHVICFVHIIVNICGNKHAFVIVIFFVIVIVIDIAITPNKYDQALWRHMASLGHNELPQKN